MKSDLKVEIDMFELINQKQKNNIYEISEQLRKIIKMTKFPRLIKLLHE